ncbi:MAG: hypothetical protein HY769_01535 [Candidatus Stahlbacteria bacterium]|nr:hypothetical protein [Candidatus Stahlbacteria bacterium]
MIILLLLCAVLEQSSALGGINSNPATAGSDTLIPSLAWPYYISQSVSIEGYKAVKFNPELPCSISKFLTCFGSPVSNTSKECSLIVWSDSWGQPGPVLFSQSISVNAADSNKLYWQTYNLVPPLFIVGQFWAGIWEGTGFPTTVSDTVTSFTSYYASDGTNWLPLTGDYFMGLVIKYVQPQLRVMPDSLVLSINADTNQSDTGNMYISNESGICNLIVDSIVACEPCVLSVLPNSFGLLPLGYKEVKVICGGVNSDGIYYDTLWIFSTASNSPYPVPLTLIVSGFGIEEESRGLRVKSRELKVSQNPFLVFTEVRGQKTEDRGQRTGDRIQVYDVMGRLVEEERFFANAQNDRANAQNDRADAQNDRADAQNDRLKIGKNLSPGIYFVKLKGYKPLKIIKMGGSPR